MDLGHLVTGDHDGDGDDDGGDDTDCGDGDQVPAATNYNRTWTTPLHHPSAPCHWAH